MANINNTSSYMDEDKKQINLQKELEEMDDE